MPPSSLSFSLQFQSFYSSLILFPSLSFFLTVSVFFFFPYPEVSVQELHSVEIVGGGSRIPSFQKQITEFLGRAPSQTLSATECIASGCAWMGAILSPNYRVRPFEVRDTIAYPISLRWGTASKFDAGDLNPEDCSQV